LRSVCRTDNRRGNPRLSQGPSDRDLCHTAIEFCGSNNIKK
jgi:hypothetical protein